MESAIDAGHIDVAAEQLIFSRATHLDSLAHKPTEPRVRAVVEPILTGEPPPSSPGFADVEYCLDLGLIVRGRPGGLEIANPIYRDVLPRELAQPVMDAFPAPVTPSLSRWSLPDGRLDMQGLLDAFVDFWRQRGEWMLRGPAWPEAAHQLVLMAFLQRVVNGGGLIEREYGPGTRRLDLLIRWFLRRDAAGIPREEERHAIEMLATMATHLRSRSRVRQMVNATPLALPTPVGRPRTETRPETALSRSQPTAPYASWAQTPLAFPSSPPSARTGSHSGRSPSPTSAPGLSRSP